MGFTLIALWALGTAASFFWMRRSTRRDAHSDTHIDMGVLYHLAISPVVGALLAFVGFAVIGILTGHLGFEARY